MTADEVIRFILIPSIGAATLVALVISLREFWVAYRNGEL